MLIQTIALSKCWLHYNESTKRLTKSLTITTSLLSPLPPSVPVYNLKSQTRDSLYFPLFQPCLSIGWTCLQRCDVESKSRSCVRMDDSGQAEVWARGTAAVWRQRCDILTRRFCHTKSVGDSGPRPSPQGTFSSHNAVQEEFDPIVPLEHLLSDSPEVWAI